MKLQTLRNILGGTLVLVIGVARLDSQGYFDSTPEPVACTMDAKQCPDGSYVGRVGPDCSFAPCPESTETGNGTGAINSGNSISFNPAPLNTNYITSLERPPELMTMYGSTPCQAIEKEIDGVSYCTSEAVEGTAGSIYTMYTYARHYAPQDLTVTLLFTLQAPQCGNYSEPEMSDCQAERDAFSVDEVVSKLFDKVKFQ